MTMEIQKTGENVAERIGGHIKNKDVTRKMGIDNEIIVKIEARGYTPMKVYYTFKITCETLKR